MPEPRTEWARWLEGIAHDAEALRVRHARVRSELGVASPLLRIPSLEGLRARDLDRLVALYDSHFFEGLLGELLRAGSRWPLELRLSNRMTAIGGATHRRRHRVKERGRIVQHYSYEIAISGVLLFQSFADVDREVVVSGVSCVDRLEALLRILEHELVHVLEFLVWDDSSCSQPRFLTLARNLFGHTAANHGLVTQAERALVNHGVRVGDLVEFDGDGTRHAGFVRRITKRATVLVEHPRGVRYTDGKRYVKWLVPLSRLRKLGAPRGGAHGRRAR